MTGVNKDKSGLPRVDIDPSFAYKLKEAIYETYKKYIIKLRFILKLSITIVT